MATKREEAVRDALTKIGGAAHEDLFNPEEPRHWPESILDAAAEAQAGDYSQVQLSDAIGVLLGATPGEDDGHGLTLDQMVARITGTGPLGAGAVTFGIAGVETLGRILDGEASEQEVAQTRAILDAAAKATESGR